METLGRTKVFVYTEKINRVHEHEQSCWAMCNRIQYFKPIQ